MDFLRSKAGSAWNRPVVSSNSSHASYQPLVAPEDLELLSSDSERDVFEDEKLAEAGEEIEITSDLEEGFPEPRRRHAYLPSFVAVRKTAFTVFVALIPSFLNYFEESKPKKLHKTAWLDGLRGVAALMVVCHHSSVLWYYNLNRGWGSSPADHHFVQLPIIRLGMSGSSNVAIFFVVSGFSLSYKPLQLIRRGCFPEVLESLGSSVMRRGMRLVLPPAFVTFFSMLATYFNLYGVGPGSRQPPMSPFFWEHLKSYVNSIIGLSDPFRPRLFPGGYNPVYDTNLWTIPVEFYGSMVIFTILLGVSKLRPRYRLALLTITVLYLNYYAYAHLFLFISGVLLCEIHHIRNSNPEPAIVLTSPILPSSSSTLPEPKPCFTPLKALKALLWTAYTLLSLHILSMPMLDFGGASSPGYRFISRHIPPHYRAPYLQDTFWIFLAAVHLVFIISCLPVLQRVFTTRLAQYLGKISFAIYICHGTVLYTLGYRLSNHIHATMQQVWVGQENWGYGIGILLTGLVVYPLLIWLSDLVARGVDAKSVSFARWMWGKVSVEG